jgi:phosphatidylinositol alpha-1,6-mannosyltransferase
LFSRTLKTQTLLITPGLGGTGAGGIQESARIAWEGLWRHAHAQGCPAALLSYGPVSGAQTPHNSDRLVAARTRLGIFVKALSRQWDSDVRLFWHLGLLKLLPVLRGKAAQTCLYLHGIEAWHPFPEKMRRLLRGVTRFLSNSDFTWHRFLSFNPEFASHPHQVTALGCQAPDREGAAPDAIPAALMLGRLLRSEDYKGHREVIAAWPRVLEQAPDAQLWIAGDGDLRPDLERAAAAIGLSERVRFLGRVSHQAKEDLLRRCRCLAMPSRAEGFGLVYLEAMRFGRPCLVSICDGGREVVNPPEAGLAADVKDGGALAGALARLLAAGPEWDQWSRAARQRFESSFTAADFQRRLVQAVFPNP